VIKNISRRNLLGALGAGSSAALLGNMLRARPVAAQDGGDGELPLLVFAYFEGGWDTLLGLDPRDEQTYGDGQGAIQTAYAQLAQGDPELGQALAATNNTGIFQPPGSNITFGPTMGALAPLYEDLCVVRGMNMGTLTHEVGRRYMLTGKTPRGLSASGSSLPTVVVNDSADASVLANLVVQNETYNENLSPGATGVKIREARDLFYLMTQVEPNLPDGAASAVDAYLERLRCADVEMDGGGLVNTFRESRSKAKELASGSLWQHFDFAGSSAEMTDLFAQFDYAAQPNAAQAAFEQAMIAAQALKHGVSQAVSISLAQGIDDHDDTYQTNHAPALRSGFEAAAKLVEFLKNPDNGSEGKPLWDRTVLVLWSEFARTPGINTRSGRDHHLSSACLVAGKGIAGNRVVGASDASYLGRPVDLDSGEPDDGGVQIKPADVHATVLEAMGLGWDHIANQDPNIISAMLKA
jgi:uncharacterized protein (DUF1501 family)